MHYEERPAAPGLRPWIRCIWHLQGDAAPPGHHGAPDRVVPDGFPEIVIQRGDPFQEYQPSNGASGVQPFGIILAGQLTGPLWLAPTGRIDCIGIRFEPHGLAALTRVPMLAATDMRHDLSRIDPDLARRLERAASAPAPLEAIESELEAALARTATRLPTWLPEAVRRLEDSPADVRIAEWSRDLDLDARRLQRAFTQSVGLTPKRFQRVLRFQRAYRQIETATSPSELALDCGYYDQAHMIRDFRQFAGRSPGRDPFDEALSQLFAGVTERG